MVQFCHGFNAGIVDGCTFKHYDLPFRITNSGTAIHWLLWRGTFQGAA